MSDWSLSNAIFDDELWKIFRNVRSMTFQRCGAGPRPGHDRDHACQRLEDRDSWVNVASAVASHGLSIRQQSQIILICRRSKAYHNHRGQNTWESS
jgi:hypothetical protein